jgi:hypothetical protein
VVVGSWLKDLIRIHPENSDTNELFDMSCEATIMGSPYTEGILHEKKYPRKRESSGL